MQCSQMSQSYRLTHKVLKSFCMETKEADWSKVERPAPLYKAQCTKLKHAVTMLSLCACANTRT